MLQECRSFPLEDSRLTVPRAQLEKHLNTMKTILAGKFSELVFNLDEIGFSEWEKRKPKTIIAPRSIPADQVFHSVSRRCHHVTLLACVSAAGDALTPMVISGPPFHNSLWAIGPRRDEDVIIRHRNPAYINEELFSNAYRMYSFHMWPTFAYSDNLRIDCNSDDGLRSAARFRARTETHGPE
jgi:hypothetical protein